MKTIAYCSTATGFLGGLSLKPITVNITHNRVMIVCLAETHPLIKDLSSNEVREIEFQIGKVDRSDNPVSGRFKSKICTHIHAPE